MNDDEYYIQSGVRRAYTAWVMGRTTLGAMLVREGQPDEEIIVPIDRLRSPKLSFIRDHRYITLVEYPMRVLGLELDPIEVQPMGADRQSASIPISQVRML